MARWGSPGGRRPLRVVYVVLGALVASSLACPSPGARPGGSALGQAPDNEAPLDLDLELDAEQAALLATLAAEADAHPEDFAALKASGLAHMRYCLSGVTRLQLRAERDLEAAFALDPSDPELNRSLGRFYNMRAVAGDTSKAERQVEVYAALLGPGVVEDPRPATMDGAEFVAYSFFMLGQILAAKDRGRSLKALAKVRRLEADLAARVAAAPDDIELHALRGNFAFFFAGNIPLDRTRRVAEAVAAFEVVRARWGEMRPGAKDPLDCPNTYENFMFELAEGYMVLGEGAKAAPIYTALSEVGNPRTRPKELIAAIAAERLRNFDDYLGEMRLMPPWPSDVGNCVVCHAWSAEVPLDSLYMLEPLSPSELPSRAHTKPVLEADPRVGQIVDGEGLPRPVAALLETRCAPCHFSKSEALGLPSLASGAEVEAASAWILEQVESGAMPPGGGLSPEARALIRDWAGSVEGGSPEPADTAG